MIQSTKMQNGGTQTYWRPYFCHTRWRKLNWFWEPSEWEHERRLEISYFCLSLCTEVLPINFGYRPRAIFHHHMVDTESEECRRKDRKTTCSASEKAAAYVHEFVQNTGHWVKYKKHMAKRTGWTLRKTKIKTQYKWLFKIRTQMAAVKKYWQ